MKWAEVIHLRAIAIDPVQLMKTVQSLIDEAKKENNCQAIKMYNRALISTDISIHLVHDSSTFENEGSQLGLCISRALKEFGMVNHSVWTEINSP